LTMSFFAITQFFKLYQHKPARINQVFVPARKWKINRAYVSFNFLKQKKPTEIVAEVAGHHTADMGAVLKKAFLAGMIVLFGIPIFRAFNFMRNIVKPMRADVIEKVCQYDDVKAMLGDDVHFVEKMEGTTMTHMVFRIEGSKGQAVILANMAVAHDTAACIKLEVETIVKSANEQKQKIEMDPRMIRIRW